MPLRPWVSAETASVIAATSSTSPATSTRCRTAADDSAIQRRLGGTSTSASTAVTHRLGRQPEPKSRSADRTAPATMPRPTDAPQTEVACSRSGPIG